jgi:uncharacterized protein YcaQ
VPRSLSAAQARKVVLRAQGFGGDRTAPVTRRSVGRVVDRLAIFQIDSVNVLTRAHYMPLYSRLGPYDVDVLHQAAYSSSRTLVEYWAHEAALVDVDLWPAFDFKMRSGDGMWGSMRSITTEQPDLVQSVLDQIREAGPLTSRQLQAVYQREREHWGWNWSEAKRAAEYLFFTGQLTAHSRNSAFERVYDLPERVLPPSVVHAPRPEPDHAHRVLIERAARALGIATPLCLRDYFRLRPAPARQAIADLIEAGTLVPVQVEGWGEPALMHREATVPRAVEARALVSPFDPLIFQRDRAQRLFDFRYRIEIYVPAAKREFGYYVLPFLLGDRLVARVDLKADRAASALIVHGAWRESHAPDHTAQELAHELQVMASWLGLAKITAPSQGDLAGELTRALTRRLD